VARQYTRFAVLLLNTAVAFVVLNGLAWLWEHRPRDIPQVEYYGIERLRQVYPGMTDADVRQLLWETYYGDDARGFAYEQITQFREPAYHGRYVNVDPAGFRLVKDQGPWPPDPRAFNIFAFGGSTTFGYGLPDAGSIPSRIQELAATAGCGRPVHLYNFGRAAYYSTQEELLFQTLLWSGARPDLAVFLDGLNDFYAGDDVLQFTPELTQLAAQRTIKQRIGILADMPLVDWTAHKLVEWRERNQSPGDLRDEATLTRLIERWQRNRSVAELLAGQAGVRTLFVLQPIPTYGYDLAYHLFYKPEPGYFGEFERAGYAYEQLSRRLPELSRGGDFLWLGDLQRDRHENLYADFVHYDDAFSRDVAAAIFGAMRERGMVPCPPA
jgi:hypothetical protein